MHFLQDHIGTNHTSPWDDYSYVTLFNAYLVHEKIKKALGAVKILAKDNKNTADYFTDICKLDTSDKISDVTRAFVHTYVVSLAVDMSYYHKLNKLFGLEQAEEILEATCDASYLSEHIDDYRSWPGFNESLLRNGSSSEATIKKGRFIAVGRYSPDDRFEISFDFPEASIETINFSFSSVDQIGESNINILIGRNGVGKTYVLRRLTELVTGVAKDANRWPYFNKLLVAAYSPFEDFHTKTSLLESLDKSLHAKTATGRPSKRRLLNINKYEYIGFRNHKNQFSLEWPKQHSAQSVLKILALDFEDHWWLDQRRFEILFDTLRLCIDFDYLVLIKKTGDFLKLAREKTLTKEEMKSLKNELDFASGVLFEKNGKNIPLSSGQSIYSYLIPCLVAEIEDESLVIVDEPELYLHPALEIGLISMLKSLLKGSSSYAIIATHSALIAREVDRKYIRILRKTCETTEILSPSFQTLGESLEMILGEAFDDYITRKPYQSDLDSFIAKAEDRDAAIESLSKLIGDEGLAYILGSNDGREEIELVELDETP